MKKKLAFVVQRYGLEVNGGAELLCRQLAEHLSAYYEIEILTTKAVDYMTWKNQYKNDTDIINGITVRRFHVARERNVEEFNKVYQEIVAEKKSSERKEMEFMELQGPYVPELVDYLEDNSEKYDFFVFFTYLYYSTYMGLPKVASKSILVPTAHDEPPIYMGLFKDFFQKPKGIFYNTKEEKEFVENKFFNQNVINNDGFGGAGVEVPSDVSGERFKKKYALEDYIIYVGRIDESKGCKELFEFWDVYKDRNDRKIQLVLLGKEMLKVPKRKDILNLGFVSDEDKFDGIAGAKLLVLPSMFESLSMVVLEAMSLKKPVIVNGKCDVLKGHCKKSNGGLYYQGYFEFEGCLNYLLGHEEESRMMGENGAEYIRENFQWDVIIGHFRDLVRRVEESCKTSHVAGIGCNES